LVAPSEITDFLKEFKRNLSKKFTFIPRRGNMDTLTKFGLTVKHVKQILANLTHKNYFNGPSRDRDRKTKMVWEFGTHIGGEEIYIKLSDDFSFSVAKCISFHEAERPIIYPFKASSGSKGR